MNTWQQFQTKYNKTSEKIKALIDSEAIPEFVSGIKKEPGLDEVRASDLIVLVSDIVLEVSSVGEGLDRLNNLGLSPDRGITVITAIREFASEALSHQNQTEAGGSNTPDKATPPADKTTNEPKAGTELVHAIRSQSDLILAAEQSEFGVPPEGGKKLATSKILDYQKPLIEDLEPNQQ